MKCTECVKETNHLHGEYWNSQYGFVIKKSEKLCDECAAKRPGYLKPVELLNMKQSELEKLDNES